MCFQLSKVKYQIKVRGKWKMENAVIVFTTAVMGIAALSTQAQSEFEKLDVNNDNYIAVEESVANIQLAAAFDKLDVNLDGKLSKKEFASFVG